MKVSVMISVIPIGTGISLSSYIAACEKILAEAGCGPSFTRTETKSKGKWDQVFGAIRRCIETVHAMGAPRVSTHLKLGTHDRDVSMEQMVRA